MASLFKPLWYCGARDVLGAAISTGTAYFYVVGSTSQFIDLYADAAETQPITHNANNPIVLDAGGRAKVYLKTPAKVLIYDSLGSLKQTIAEGTATDAGLVNCSWGGSTAQLDTVLTDIETNLGSGALYKESSTAGVVERTYHDVVRQFISPYDFDAAGNGTADDTTALQSAINRAIATGLPLNLEDGTYKITGGLTCAGILRGVYGEGMGKSVIQASGSGFTGLTAVVSGGYLRDFSLYLLYDGTTYDTAISISGSTCTVERVDVKGGQGIVSTAPYTRVVDCVVNFKCPNTAGAYGSGVDVTANSVVENCSINGQVGNSSSYLTRGIYMQTSGGESTSVAVGCRVTNCYIGTEGGVSLRTEFDTCTTGVKCLGQRTGAAFCRMTSCTTPYVGSAADFPLNIANHFDGTLQEFESDMSYQTSASATPTFIVYPHCRTHVFHCTYNGHVTTLTVALEGAATAWGRGAKTDIIIQTNSTAIIDAFSWSASMVTASAPTVNDSTAVCSTWTKGYDKLVQTVDWQTRSGELF